MESRKLLIGIRSVSIILLIFGIAIFRKDNVDVNTVVLVLFFIINNQIRFFIFDRKRELVIASILLECIISYYCYSKYGGIEFFYFFSAALDGAFLLETKITYAVNTMLIIIMIIIIKNTGTNEIISSVSTLLTISILSVYIKDENNRKVSAQELYDKLRISEDKLRKANNDLEIYANSIEEITLLRERNRISREIHDSVGHSLSTIIVQLRAIEKIGRNDGNSAADIAGSLREFAQNSLEEVRKAVRELKPNEYHKYEGILGIEELIKSFTKFTGIDVKLGFTKEKWPLSSDQSFVIYRVVQEFLSNSLRHGKATKVNIFMNFSRSDLIVSLQDNGIGADDIKKGIGLTSIWERVNELGGTVEYNSKKGEGFLLKVILKAEESFEF